jgi:hypothetical protein
MPPFLPSRLTSVSTANRASHRLGRSRGGGRLKRLRRMTSPSPQSTERRHDNIASPSSVPPDWAAAPVGSSRCARTLRRRTLPTRQPIAATPVDTVPPCGPPRRRLQPADLIRDPYAPRAPGSKGLWRRVGRPMHPRPRSPHRLRTCPAQIRPSPDRARVRPTAQASPPDSGHPVHRDSRCAYTPSSSRRPGARAAPVPFGCHSRWPGAVSRTNGASYESDGTASVSIRTRHGAAEVSV